MSKQSLNKAVLGGCLALAVLTVFVLAPQLSRPESPAEATPVPPVTLKPVSGTNVKRITLTPRAAERLGIETSPVSEQTIVSTLIVGGLVVAAESIQQATLPGIQAQEIPVRVSDPQVLVSVTVSRGEWEELANDKPARLLPQAFGVDPGDNEFGLPSGLEPVEDQISSMLTIFYRPAGNDSILQAGDRLRVELPLAGAVEAELVVPYKAVYYDASGEVWVYVNPEPLEFQRRKIVVERIAGDWAVLSDGPAIGTKVVTVGAALLYGTEIFGK